MPGRQHGGMIGQQVYGSLFLTGDMGVERVLGEMLGKGGPLHADIYV